MASPDTVQCFFRHCLTFLVYNMCMYTAQAQLLREHKQTEVQLMKIPSAFWENIISMVLAYTTFDKHTAPNSTQTL